MMQFNSGRPQSQHEGSQASGTQLLDPNSSSLVTSLAELMNSDNPFLAYDDDEGTSVPCGSPALMLPECKFGGEFAQPQMEALLSCKVGDHAFSNSSTQSGNGCEGGFFHGRHIGNKVGRKVENNGMGEKNMYCLARVDEATGLPVRRATLQEAEELCRALAATGRQHLVLDYAGGLTGGNFQRALNGGKRGPTSNGKGGGPCEHCGITESPQWRRGPPAKPVLCNACGTRYRRTGQLSPPQQSPGGKTRQMSKRRWDRKDSREACLVYCEAS